MIGMKYLNQQKHIKVRFLWKRGKVMENIRRWFENDKVNNGQDYEIYEYEGHLEARTDTVIFMIVEPHSGTKNRWMLRVSTRTAFDRWANSTAIEEFFDSDIELCNYLYDHQLDIYKDLIKYLSSEYDDIAEEYQQENFVSCEIKKGDNMLNVGDYVGQINKDSSGVWKLYKDKINKITTTRKYGRRYFTKTVFRPLDADDVDNNTKDMEESIGKGYILTREVFGLNDNTEPYAERWIKWANENPDKANGLI